MSDFLQYNLSINSILQEWNDSNGVLVEKRRGMPKGKSRTFYKVPKEIRREKLFDLIPMLKNRGYPYEYLGDKIFLDKLLRIMVQSTTDKETKNQVIDGITKDLHHVLAEIFPYDHVAKKQEYFDNKYNKGSKSKKTQSEDAPKKEILPEPKNTLPIIETPVTIETEIVKLESKETESEMSPNSQTLHIPNRSRIDVDFYRNILFMPIPDGYDEQGYAIEIKGGDV